MNAQAHGAGAWVCDVCGTAWLENPVPKGIHGCPECGQVPYEALNPPPRRGILGWLRDLLDRATERATIETVCPGAAEWAIACRGVIDGELRCSRCGTPVPGYTHPLVRIAAK